MNLRKEEDMIGVNKEIVTDHNGYETVEFHEIDYFKDNNSFKTCFSLLDSENEEKGNFKRKIISIKKIGIDCEENNEDEEEPKIIKKTK